MRAKRIDHVGVAVRDKEKASRFLEDALGARKVDIGQGEQPWVVLADPEGNEFCVLGARHPS